MAKWLAKERLKGGDMPERLHASDKSAFYAADFFLFLRYPERAVIGYKG